MSTDAGGRRVVVRKPKAKPQPKLASDLLGGIKQSTQTVLANPKAGTATQRKAARADYSSKPLAQRKAIVRKAKANTTQGSAVLHEHASRVVHDAEAKQATQGVKAATQAVGKIKFKPAKKHGKGLSLGFITDPAYIADIPVSTINAVSGLHIPQPGQIPKTALAAIKNIGIATYEDPDKVIPSTGREAANTLRGLGAAGLGTLRAAGDAAIHPSHVKRLPGAAEKAVKSTVADYKRRYGDVLSDPKAFRERVKKEGALSYALDLAPEIGVAGKAVGHGLGAVGRKVAKVESDVAPVRAARAVTGERPKLRTGAGPDEVRVQPRSKNLIRGTAQELKDRRRAAAVVKRTQKNGGRTPGLVPNEGEVVRAGAIKKTSLRAQEKELRRATAKASSRAGLRTRRDQGREVHGSKESSAALTKKLNKHEADGLKYAIQLGIRDPATAERELGLHLKKVLAEREAGHDFHGDFDEVPVIERILKDPEAVFTPKLAEVADAERERAKRVAGIHPDLADERAVARQHADQAAHVGEERQGASVDDTAAKREVRSARLAVQRAVERVDRAEGGQGNLRLAKGALKHQTERAQEAEQALTAARTATPEPLGDMIARVRAKATERGLVEPGYVHGHVYDEGANAPYSGHNVGRAMAGDHQYTGSSFAAGRQDTSAEALRLGLARGIKRAHNYRAVADIVDRSSPEWGRGLTNGAAKEEVRRRGLDPKSWALIDTGKVRETLDIDGEPVAEGTSGPDPKIAYALKKNIYDLDGVPAEYASTHARFTLMPKAVVNELEQGMTPTGRAIRAAAKFQGLQSRALLAPNPTFVPVQIVSNTPLALLAMKGNVRHLLSAQRWYKNLDREARDLVDDNIGASVSHALSSTPRWGDSSAGRFTKMWDAVINNQRYREFAAGAKNPLQWNSMLDEKQNNFFRRAVFYNQAKRDAAARMGKSAGAIMDLAPSVMDALKMPAGPERAAALRAVERDAEQIGEHVDEMLGDFTTYTATERKYLKTGIMFYGFMRWATRLAFYTLPVKHPIATSMVGKLGQLHNDEVVELLASAADDQGIGKKDEVARLLREDGALSYVFGRSYVMKDGHLEFVDAARLNPLLGPVVDALDSIPGKGLVVGAAKAGLGLLSPAAVATLDAVPGKSSFTGSGLKNGEGNPLSGEQNTDYIIGQVLRSVYPARVADALLHPGPQADNAIPLLHPVDANATSAGAQARNQQKRQERGSNAEYLLDNLLPMIRTRRDGTMRGIAAELAKQQQADQKKRKKVKVPGSLPDLPALPAAPSLPALPSLP